MASKLGEDKEIKRIESACASGGLALKETAISILSGFYKVVIIICIEKMSEVSIDQVRYILVTSASKIEIK